MDEPIDDVPATAMDPEDARRWLEACRQWLLFSAARGTCPRVEHALRLTQVAAAEFAAGILKHAAVCLREDS